MKKTKIVSIFAVVLLSVVLLTAFCLPVSAATVIDSGSCGENLTYTLDSDGVLTVSGTGDMTNYSPWDSYNADIKTVIMEDGVKSIGENAFSGCTGLTSVTIPNSVEFIGDDAFKGCTGLKEIFISASVSYIGWDAIPVQTVIIGKDGSYAQKWAKKNKQKFQRIIGKIFRTLNPKIIF